MSIGVRRIQSYKGRREDPGGISIKHTKVE
jgi:hypothetical protein